MTNETMTPLAGELPAAPGELPPLGGRIGAGAAGEAVKKRSHKRRTNAQIAADNAGQPGAPADPLAAPVVVAKCSPERAKEIVNLCMGMIDPITNGLAEKLDPAAKKIAPDFTFRLAGAERERLEAIGSDCIQTLPASVMPPWLPWVVLAVVAGGSAWSRYSMVKQINAGAKAPAQPAAPAPVAP